MLITSGCAVRARAGDWEVLAAIVFVATSGCTWRQLPPIVGACWQTAHQHFIGHDYGRLFQVDPSCPF
ncbi:putative transposase of IS4/5 family DUF4096 [Streptomyces sp. TLI_171]|nr:putative transposase of IS4/5 family DUF4096 [Streptomyces sp. TLI_171]